MGERAQSVVERAGVVEDAEEENKDANEEFEEKDDVSNSNSDIRTSRALRTQSLKLLSLFLRAETDSFIFTPYTSSILHPILPRIARLPIENAHSPLGVAEPHSSAQPAQGNSARDEGFWMPSTHCYLRQTRDRVRYEPR